MYKPFDSVIVLAQFELDAAAQARAAELLADVLSWKAWLDQVEVHGLSGFAAKHIQAYDLPVPKATRLSIAALNVRHKSAAAARHKALCEISAAFAKESLSWLALKGAALMPLLYQQPQLRPMRDMDILMPRTQLQKAAEIMRDLGYNLPKEQPSKFMRDMHQLPNASKMVDGFLISVELHSDGISREVPGHFYFPEDPAQIQTVDWQGLRVPALVNPTFVHQVSKHLEGLHSDATLKLINVMDVIGFAHYILERGEFDDLAQQYPNLLNTLRVLHSYTPLPAPLQDRVGDLPDQPIQGVGEIMGSLRNAMLGKHSLRKRLSLLFNPSDWWLYLYYNVHPKHSLLWVKCVRHPLRLANWFSRRLFSRVMGG